MSASRVRPGQPTSTHTKWKRWLLLQEKVKRTDRRKEGQSSWLTGEFVLNEILCRRPQRLLVRASRRRSCYLWPSSGQQNLLCGFDAAYLAAMGLNSKYIKVHHHHVLIFEMVTEGESNQEQIYSCCAWRHYSGICPLTDFHSWQVLTWFWIPDFEMNFGKIFMWEKIFNNSESSFLGWR